MFKNVCTAAILTHILILAEVVASKDLQQCNARCMDICESCEAQDGCNDEEMDCGIEDTSPTFHRSCSLDKRICVAKNCSCKYEVNVVNLNDKKQQHNYVFNMCTIL